jgi:hypothetical protein
MPVLQIRPFQKTSRQNTSSNGADYSKQSNFRINENGD